MNTTRKELRAKYRAAHGPDWWKDADLKMAFNTALTPAKDASVRAKKAAATKKLNRATKERAFKSAVYKVLGKHRAKKHFMCGGDGVTYFVWVNGICFGSMDIADTSALCAELKAVPGYSYCKFNID